MYTFMGQLHSFTVIVCICIGQLHSFRVIVCTCIGQLYSFRVIMCTFIGQLYSFIVIIYILYMSSTFFFYIYIRPYMGLAWTLGI